MKKKTITTPPLKTLKIFPESHVLLKEISDHNGMKLQPLMHKIIKYYYEKHNLDKI